VERASPDPFLMAVAVGASCAFLTPIGHQNNTLVLGPGGFRFGDYWRLGLPVQLVVIVVSIPVLLVVWPLQVGGAPGGGPHIRPLPRAASPGTS